MQRVLQADVTGVEAGAGAGAVAGADAICCLASCTMVTRFDCCLVDCVSAYLSPSLSLSQKFDYVQVLNCPPLKAGAWPH